jgi:hypothetical protein
MVRYLVESYVPNHAGSVGRMRAAASALAQSSAVRYVRAIVVPEDETCFHVVEAVSAEDVGIAACEASVAFERIVEAFEISRRDLR